MILFAYIKKNVYLCAQIGIFGINYSYIYIMKRFFSLIVTAMMSVGLSCFAADVVFNGSADFGEQGTNGEGSEISLTKDGVTFSCDKGFSAERYSAIRCYTGSVIRISSEKKMALLEFEFYSTYNGRLESSYSIDSKEWTVTLTAQARFEKISVTFGTDTEQPTDSVPDTPAGDPITVQLDPKSAVNWPVVGLYAWLNTTDGRELYPCGSWPGTQVSKDSKTGWWSYTFPEAYDGILNIIWNNYNSTDPCEQTVDIENVDENTCFRLGGSTDVYGHYYQSYAVCPTGSDSVPVTPTDSTDTPDTPAVEGAYNVAEVIAGQAAGTIKDGDSIRVIGIINRISLKGKNFAQYGSACIYVSDVRGKSGSVEFFNCLSLNKAKFTATNPEYDNTNTNWADFNSVTDGSNNTFAVGDTVMGAGKYKLYVSTSGAKTHELDQNCFLLSLSTDSIPVTPGDSIPDTPGDSIPDTPGDSTDTPTDTIFYHLTLVAQGGGTVAMNPKGGKYEAGTQVTIVASDGTGNRFHSWSDGKTENPRQITMNSDQRFFAVFLPEYELKISAGEGGTVNSSVNGTYIETQCEEILATPKEGYEFVQWSDKVKTNPRIVTISEDITLKATFREKEQGIHDIESGIRIEDGHHRISISCESPQTIVIYTIAGQVLTTEREITSTTVAVTPGLYLVRANNKTYKVIVK